MTEHVTRHLAWSASLRGTLSAAIADSVEELLGAVLAALPELEDAHSGDLHGRSAITDESGQGFVLVLRLEKLPAGGAPE